tara:strand:+ start:64 stop:480 length:417 start_codon:yes stop_codon:yes gene_type:complete
MKLLKIIILIILIPGNVIAGTVYFKEGLKLYEKKEFNKAKFKFEQDLVYNPKSEKSYLYLSKIFNIQNKNKLEKKNLKSVILINPKNEEATYNLAVLQLKESDFLGSKQLVEQLLIFCKEYCQKSEKLKIEIEDSLKK